MNRFLFVIIIALAAFFYFLALDRNDVVNDEASYMARGLHMLDFNFGIEQPTPIQWVETVPWWMNFSFHDHPLLVFLIENISFKILGENLFAGRFPAALAGVISVVFLYFIGRELYSKSIGVISSLIFAVTLGHVWISRVALQESIVIALMLTASYTFLRSLNSSVSISMVRTIDIDTKQKKRTNKKWFLAAWALLGFAFLAKYTTLILIPIFLTILYRKRSDYLKNIYFPISLLLFFAIISPVIIYNIGLYKTFGHFDFQFSYLLNQKMEEWPEMPGKEEIGSLKDRLLNYLPTLFATNSPLFLLLSFAGIFLMARRISSHAIFFCFLAWLAILMLVIGPTERFLTMLVPWLSISAAVFISRIIRLINLSPFTPLSTVRTINIFSNKRVLAVSIVFVLILLFETFYSYNSAIALSAVGRAPWVHAAEVRKDNNNWGYNQREDFLAQELAEKRPDPAISFDYPVIAKLLEKAVEKDIKRGLEPKSIMIVYNGNQALGAQLWTFLRRSVYDGWPTADAETYYRVIKENGVDYFKKLGIAEIYFIQNTKNVLLREVRNRPLTNDGDIFEAELTKKGITPIAIKNLRGEIAFLVYKTTL